MFCPEGCGLLHQAVPDTILKCLDHPFYLPIGFIIANSDVVVDDAQPFTEPCEAACKLSIIVCLDIVWLAPMGNQVIIQELGGPPAVYQGHGVGLTRLEKGSTVTRR